MQKKHSILNKLPGRIGAAASVVALIILFACQHGKSQANNSVAKADTTVTIKGKTVITTDSLSNIAGSYSCKCLVGDKQINLQIKKGREGLTADMDYQSGKFKSHGILHPDTVNFGKDFNIWSFTDGKGVYGFRFTHDEQNRWMASLINEDYKKELNSCSDAKVIDFARH